MIIGKETCLVIDDVVRSINEHGILGNGYQKAVDAFHNYIQQTERLRIRLKKKGCHRFRNQQHAVPVSTEHYRVLRKTGYWEDKRYAVFRRVS